MKLPILLLSIALSSDSFAKDCIVKISAFEGVTTKKLFQDVETSKPKPYSVGLSDYSFSINENYIYIHKGELINFEYTTIASTKSNNINIQTDVFDTLAGEMKWLGVSCIE